MNKLQILAKTTNRVLVGVFFILLLGWFHQAETKYAKYPYAPIITEISPFPFKGESAWIEFHNPLTEPVYASDLMIVINDEYEYAFPKSLPPVPPNGFIILILDGKGKSAKYQPNGCPPILHTPWDLNKVMKGKPYRISYFFFVHYQPFGSHGMV